MEQNEFRLTNDQQRVFAAFRSFIAKAESRVFILQGYAGTGKTTLIRFLIDELKRVKTALTAYWQGSSDNEKPFHQERLNGVVVKLLKEQSYGRDGFIKGEDMQSYYFFIPVGHPKFSAISIGQNLNFIAEKTMKGLKAVKIKYL